MRNVVGMMFMMLLAVNASAVSKGGLAPNIKLPGLQNAAAGQIIQLSDMKGKVVYVDFWASWCGPCRISMPILNELRATYGAQGFEVLAVNVDEDPLDAINYLSEVPVSYPVVSDPAGSTPEMFEVKGMPTAYLLDKEGRVRLVHEGFNKADVDGLKKEIEALLAE